MPCTGGSCPHSLYSPIYLQCSLISPAPTRSLLPRGKVKASASHGLAASSAPLPHPRQPSTRKTQLLPHRHLVPSCTEALTQQSPAPALPQASLCPGHICPVCLLANISITKGTKAHSGGLWCPWCPCCSPMKPAVKQTQAMETGQHHYCFPQSHHAHAGVDASSTPLLRSLWNERHDAPATHGSPV